MVIRLSFVDVEANSDGFLRIGFLLLGLAGLWFFARSHWIEVTMSRLIAGALKKYSDLGQRDYGSMLHLAGDYAVIELKIGGDSGLANRTLENLDLQKERILVLGITNKSGEYEGAPKHNAAIEPGDTVILYGPASALDKVDRR